MTKILVVASHPDDEILGVGGTIAAHAAQGDMVHILIMAEGATSRQQAAGLVKVDDELEGLRDAARKAASVLGAQPPEFLGMPDNRMDSLDMLDVIQHVETVVERLQPDVIYTHHGGDLNIDHRITFEAVLTATRPMPGSKPMAVYSFETVSSTEWASDEIGIAFRPQRYIDITSVQDQKRDALEAYAVEMRDYPHARSMEAVSALSRLRGSQAGFEAAEAFMLIREKTVL